MATGSRTCAATASAVLLLVCVLLTGCSGADRECTRNAKLVPRCGVLWGVATDPTTAGKLHSVEQSVGRRFDMVYRFHDLDDRLPTPDERAIVRSGHILHISIDSRIYAPPSRTIPWSAVAAGKYDAVLRADARGIASLNTPVFITYDHEADHRAALTGSTAGFVAAWRHVVRLFARAGANNAVWVWVLTGYPPYLRLAGSLWPGNRYVDWISWDAYNNSGCLSDEVDVADYRTFGQAVLPFYDWVHRTGPSYGIDPGKPLMISEAASIQYPADAARTATWYDDVPLVLHQHPQIKAIGLWDRPGPSSCRYQFDNTPAVRAAIASVGKTAAVTGGRYDLGKETGGNQ